MNEVRDGRDLWWPVSNFFWRSHSWVACCFVSYFFRYKSATYLRVGTVYIYTTTNNNQLTQWQAVTWRRDGNSTRHSSQATPCCQLPATSTCTHSRRRRLSTMAGLPRCWPVTSDDPRGQAPSRPPCDWPHHWREVLLLTVSRARRWWKHFSQIQFSNYPTVLGCSVHLNVALVVEQTGKKNQK